MILHWLLNYFYFYFLLFIHIYLWFCQFLPLFNCMSYHSCLRFYHPFFFPFLRDFFVSNFLNCYSFPYLLPSYFFTNNFCIFLLLKLWYASLSYPFRVLLNSLILRKRRPLWSSWNRMILPSLQKWVINISIFYIYKSNSNNLLMIYIIPLRERVREWKIEKE